MVVSGLMVVVIVGVVTRVVVVSDVKTPAVVATVMVVWKVVVDVVAK